MTLEFQASDLSKIEVSTLDYLVHKIKHDIAIVTGGTKTDLLSDWCQCKNRNPWPDVVEVRKYYHQAYHYFKIGAFASDRVPKFRISMQDLEPSILRELAYLDNEDWNFVLKQAVGRIFEDINSRLYHVSISKLLEIELVD